MGYSSDQAADGGGGPFRSVEIRSAIAKFFGKGKKQMRQDRFGWFFKNDRNFGYMSVERCLNDEKWTFSV